MIRINYLSPTLTDTCSYYRGFGPLSELARTNDHIQLFNICEINWATINQLDAVFFPRVYEPQMHGAMELCLKNRKPCWLDYDDNIFCVPRSNPAFNIFANRDQILSDAAERASVITVATESLYKLYRTYNKNTVVVPNAYNDLMFGELPETKREKVRLVIWRGSNTHDEDLISIQDELVEIVNSEAFSSWKILFMGHNPAYMTCRMRPERVLFRAPTDPIEYFNYMRNQNAAIQIVPLVDTEFNRSKSNISWIEGTVANAAVFAQDLPEFRRPGITNFNRATFGKVLSEAIISANQSGDFLSSLREQSAKFIKENLMLSLVNKQRLQILHDISKK